MSFELYTFLWKWIKISNLGGNRVNKMGRKRLEYNIYGGENRYFTKSSR